METKHICQCVQTIFMEVARSYLVSRAATASGSSKQAWHIRDAVCTVLELLMIGGEIARNL